MREKPCRVLIVADHPEIVELLDEAFLEINDNRFSHSCMMECRTEHVLDGIEAEELLRQDRFDVVLLDLSLQNNGGLPAFHKIRTEAPETPVIILADSQDETMAISLIRQGADDYLIKSTLDCIPLSQALRCSVERARLQQARQSLSLIDGLTDLYNERGFVHLGERHWRLAERFSLYVAVLLVQVGGLDGVKAAMGQQESDMAAIEVTEILRESLGETDLLARLQTERFGAIAVFGNSEEARQKIELARGKLQRLATAKVATAITRVPGTASLEELIAQAERTLCEGQLLASGVGAS